MNNPLSYSILFYKGQGGIKLRRTYRKNDFRELNRQIIIIGLLFMMSIVVGSYINKVLPGSSNNILNNINPAVSIII